MLASGFNEADAIHSTGAVHNLDALLADILPIGVDFIPPEIVGVRSQCHISHGMGVVFDLGVGPTAAGAAVVLAENHILGLFVFIKDDLN